MVVAKQLEDQLVVKSTHFGNKEAKDRLCRSRSTRLTKWAWLWTPVTLLSRKWNSMTIYRLSTKSSFGSKRYSRIWCGTFRLSKRTSPKRAISSKIQYRFTKELPRKHWIQGSRHLPPIGPLMMNKLGELWKNSFCSWKKPKYGNRMHWTRKTKD